MDNRFRTLQAVADLNHHIKALLPDSFAHLADAAGISLAQTGEALRLLRDDNYNFCRTETLPLRRAVETLAGAQTQGRDVAALVLLSDVLQSQTPAPHLAQVWPALSDGLPATLRAALANGLRRAMDLGLVTADQSPSDADCLTRPASQIADPLLRIARSMRHDEIYDVAGADQGRDLQVQFAALVRVIGVQDGIFAPGDARYPALVVEQTAVLPKRAGFEGSTAILLLNALQSGDAAGWFAQRWPVQGAVYCALQPSRRDAILGGVRFLYESDRDFCRDWLVDSAGRLGEGATIPFVTSLD